MLMSDNIKIEGEKKVFEGGAIRYEKRKGRFDLLPTSVIYDILCTAKKFDDMKKQDDVINYAADIRNLQLMAYSDHTNIESLIRLIVYISINRYFVEDFDETYDGISCCVYTMLKDLAKHVQEGAEKYGERNCEKGIPLWSFVDSGLRHLNQYLLGETDEPHHIAAIWNFMYAVWTIMHEKDEKSAADICEELAKEYNLKLEKNEEYGFVLRASDKEREAVLKQLDETIDKGINVAKEIRKKNVFPSPANPNPGHRPPDCFYTTGRKRQRQMEDLIGSITIKKTNRICGSQPACKDCPHALIGCCEIYKAVRNNEANRGRFWH